MYESTEAGVGEDKTEEEGMRQVQVQRLHGHTAAGARASPPRVGPLGDEACQAVTHVFRWVFTARNVVFYWR